MTLEKMEQIIDCCVDGNLEALQPLLNKYNSNNIRTAFNYSCIHGQLHIIIYLINLYKTQQSLNPQRKINNCINSTGFEFLCRYGHLHIIKYLCNYEKIKIHSNHEEGFYNACKFGHLNIAKYLLGLYKYNKLHHYTKINFYELPSGDYKNYKINIFINSIGDNNIYFNNKIINL